MIGIIGARDSVSTILDVADSMRLDVSVVHRCYDIPEDAGDLTRELDELCTVILFSGRAPYLIARASGATRARLDYVPHEGVDLMREMARLMMEPGPVGRGVELSLDSIAQEDASEVLLELGMRPDMLHCIPLESLDREKISTEAIGRRHEELHAAGTVDFCLTCLDSVNRWLRQRGVPVRRVRHARSVVRAALERSVMAADLGRAVNSQVAVVTVVSRSHPSADLAPLTAVTTNVSRLLDAKVVGISAHGAELVTTRGAIERRARRGVSPADVWGPDGSADFTFGIGVGATIASAEQNSERAVSFARVDGRPFVVGDDGAHHAFDAYSAPAPRTSVGEGRLGPARLAGLSPMSLQKLVHAFHQAGGHEITAARLGALYGVSARRARSLLNDLTEHGYAERSGQEQGAGAGRPQTVYRVNIDRIVGGIDSASGAQVAEER